MYCLIITIKGFVTKVYLWNAELYATCILTLLSYLFFDVVAVKKSSNVQGSSAVMGMAREFKVAQKFMIAWLFVRTFSRRFFRQKLKKTYN